MSTYIYIYICGVPVSLERQHTTKAPKTENPTTKDLRPTTKDLRPTTKAPVVYVCCYCLVDPCVCVCPASLFV